MKKTCSGGFTLIEMMITITIAGVLLAIAAPSFRDIVINNRTTAQTNDLVSVLALARSEAIKRGTAVRVMAATGGFANGWTIQVGSEILQVHEALQSGFSLDGAGFTNTSEIQYQATGRSDSSGTFTLCYSGYTGRVVTVSVTGRVSTAKTTSVCP